MKLLSIDHPCNGEMIMFPANNSHLLCQAYLCSLCITESDHVIMHQADQLMLFRIKYKMFQDVSSDI